jgi:hypothetical protein
MEKQAFFPEKGAWENAFCIQNVFFSRLGFTPVVDIRMALHAD